MSEELSFSVCDLKAPAKCAKVEIRQNTPFAWAGDCEKCQYKKIITFVTGGKAKK